jgi:uncharacterized membrane protein YoaK (UPF0700 family)
MSGPLLDHERSSDQKLEATGVWFAIGAMAVLGLGLSAVDLGWRFTLALGAGALVYIAVIAFLVRRRGEAAARPPGYFALLLAALLAALVGHVVSGPTELRRLLAGTFAYGVVIAAASYANLWLFRRIRGGAA